MQTQTTNPILKSYSPPSFSGFHDPEVASFEGVVTKSAFSLGLVALVGAMAYMLIPPALLQASWIVAMLATIAVSFVVMRKPVVKPHHVALFALAEGVFVGAASKFFNMVFPGIVLQAVLATFVVAAVALVFYRVSGVRVSSKARKYLSIATLSLLGLYLVNLGLSLVGFNTGLVEAGPNAGLLSMAISVIAVCLATFSLVTDFDTARALVEARAPEREELRLALGITATLVWLYVELLRVISYFRD